MSRLYDGLVHPVAQQLFSRVQRFELLKAGDRVGVAVSGGIDSVALLRLLLELRFELGIVISVVHFNHKLRGAESDADEEFVANLAREHDLQFYVDRGDVATHAREQSISLETAARELRYRFFRSLICAAANTPPGANRPAVPQNAGECHGISHPFSGLDKIVTGHTLDDQAETVLMRMIRGAGMRGLGAIYPRIEVEDDDGEFCGEIVRPLLGTRRCQLQQFLQDLDQSWREDSTNADHHFTRNRVRKLLVPLLEHEFNPKIASGLAELAEIAREEEEYWENEIAGWMGTAVRWTEPEWIENQPAMGHLGDLVQIGSLAESAPAPRVQINESSSLAMNASIDRLWLLGEPLAVQRRLIKAIAEQARIPLEFKHISEILRFTAESGPAGKELALPLGWKLLRESAELIFLTPDLRKQNVFADYAYSLVVPGRTIINEIGSEIDAQIVPSAGQSVSELDRLLSADVLQGPLTIRNWRAGDRFRPVHTKSPKKLKELLAEIHVPHTVRATWPVISSSDDIVWVRGFPVSSRHRAKAGERALFIREMTFSRDESE